MKEAISSSYSITLFLRIFAVIFGAIGFPVTLIYGLFSLQLLLTAAGSLVVTVPLFFVVHLLGEQAGTFLFGFGRKPGKREQLESELLKARHFLASGRLERAAELADFVLSREPNYSAALLIRAQVALRQDDEVIARDMLRRIVVSCPRSDVNRKWALNYLRELNENSDNR